jgi:hypothetical protein
LKRGKCDAAERQTLGLRVSSSSEEEAKRVRGNEERETLSSRFSRGELERCKSSREQWHHPKDKHQSGAGCAAGLGSTNRWSAVVKPSGFTKKRRSGMMRETSIMPQERKKALKSKTHERGELKKASTGQNTYPRREGSQTLRVGLLEDMATSSKRPANAGRKKGVFGLRMLKGRGMKQGDLFEGSKKFVAFERGTGFRVSR